MAKGSKGGKSSASAGTRKKNAKLALKKAGADPDAAPKPPQRGQKGSGGGGRRSKKEPRKKVFVPPPKPPAPPPDPLDDYGLASSLPPALVVLTRKASKKDVVTRTRACEALFAWVAGGELEGETLGEEERKETEVIWLTCWAHLFPRLSISPTRRLRYLAASIHAALLEQAHTRSELVTVPAYVLSTLAPLAVLAHDTDRRVARAAKAALDGSTRWNGGGEDRLDVRYELHTLLPHLKLLLLSPSPAAALHAAGPSQPSAPGTPGTSTPSALDAKNRDDGSIEEDVRTTDGRLAAGAAGALCWIIVSHPAPLPLDDFEEILASSALWNLLRPPVAATGAASRLHARPADADAQPGSVGAEAPLARARAWAIIAALVSSPERAALDCALPAFGPVAIRAIWAETDATCARAALDALLPLLRIKPETWTMREDDEESDEEDEDEEEPSAAADEVEADDDSDEVSAASDSDDDEAASAPVKAPSVAAARSVSLPRALRPFQGWLRSACAGLPSLSYPTVLVLLSTLPVTLLAPTAEHSSAILDSHWAGLQARAGSDPQALRACIASFAECVAFLASRVARNEDAQADEASVLADAQLAKPWQAFVLDDGSIGADLVPPRARAALDPAQPISAAVKRLASLAEDGSVAAPFLARVRATLQQLAQPDADADALFRAVRCLSAIGTAGAPNGLEKRVSDLVQDVSGTAANVLCASPEETWLAPLVSLLAALMGSFADAHADLLEVLGRAARDVLPPAMHRGSVSAPAAAAFYAAYLPMVQDASERSAVWISALESVSPQGGLDTDALQALFGAADSLPAALLSEGETGSTRLDQEVLALVARALKTGSLKQSEQAVLGRLLDRPEPFVTRQTADALLLELVTALKSGARSDIATVLALLEAWGSSRERTQRLVTDPALQGAAAAIFGLAYLDASPEYGTSAARVWASLADEQGAPQAAAAMLRERVLQLDTPLRSLLRAAEALPAGAGGLAILPDKDNMAECLAAACASAPPPALAVVDALVPHAGGSSETGGPYDTAGLSSYARALVVLVDVLRRDRALARAAPWTLAHAVYLALAAEDATLLPGASPTLFAPSVSEQSLAAHAVAAVNVATTAVASLADAVTDAWHAEVAETLKKAGASSSGLASSLQVAYSIGHAQGARVFARLLAGVLSFSAAGATAGSTWLRLGQGIQTTKPALAGALMRTVRPTVLAAPLYDRVRNELVANLAGVPAARAESAGLPLLRLLVAAAPPADATVALVPPQRALLFLQTVQKWLAADDVELSDELHVRLSEVLLELLPIVEGMPGSHLELICDVLEAQLDAAAWSDAHAMYAALRLLEALEERSAHAEALRLVWKERSKPIRALLAPLFLEQTNEVGAPYDAVAQLLSHLVRRLPDDTFEGQEEALVEALQSRRQCVQLAAYRRLSLCIRSRVAALVLDAALEPEMAAGASALPDALIRVCCVRSKSTLASAEDAVPSDEDGLSAPPKLSFFLAWLAVFEHFEEASLSLRSAFAAQLEKRELLENELLPGLFEWMSPLEMRGWAVEEVYLDDVVFGASALPLLAAHLYHRALTHTPVGVRKHVQSLRNRNLSTQITQLTSRHFTPLLAAAELAHLRAPEARATLEGEGLGVRITASNDVVATYTVDEHDMQIAVSIPQDFPLHGVEVKDVKRVGVTEAQWRAWLLATQQLLTGKNGLIYDALLLFKRNAEAKFAGYEDAECAICYSIIGDGSLSLPTKKCKTCHKGYHSSCLVKWVVSSGSSTCPMCRAML